MSTELRPAPAPEVPPPRRPEQPVGTFVAGLILLGAGFAWLLDVLGWSVPWAAAPAAALVVVGVVLVATAWLPGHRTGLVVLGAGLLAVAAVLAVAGPVRGPVGERTFAPTAGQWPASTSMSAGTYTVDLTQHALPASGRYAVSVGAGTVVVRLPAGSDAVHVVAHVRMGTVLVDGTAVDSGMGVEWADRNSGSVVVDVTVGMGEVEVQHV